MSTKSRTHLFQVRLNWLEGTMGELSSREASGTIHVATPPAFGGEGKPWTPEHYFLAALSSCFMTSYLAFARKMEFPVVELECEAVGQVSVVEGRLKFTQVDLYPTVCIESEELREKANFALQKTHKYCLIANSVNMTIYYHDQVLVCSPLSANGPLTRELL